MKIKIRCINLSFYCLLLHVAKGKAKGWNGKKSLIFLQWLNSTVWHGWRFQLGAYIFCQIFNSVKLFQYDGIHHSMWLIQEMARKMNVIYYVIKKNVPYHNSVPNVHFKNLLVNVAVRSNYDKAQVLKQNVKRHVNYLPYLMHFLVAENILKKL